MIYDNSLFPAAQLSLGRYDLMYVCLKIVIMFFTNYHTLESPHVTVVSLLTLLKQNKKKRTFHLMLNNRTEPITVEKNYLRINKHWKHCKNKLSRNCIANFR